MCLAIPMKLIQIKGERGLVEVGNVQREVGLQLIEDVEVGDYLIIHAGFAIQKLDEKEALETLALFREMENL
jgi:hydrogenase expression/formation protein HypC